jgi:competence protein ComEC
MRQGRDIVGCTLAVLAGNLLGDTLTLPPFLYLALSLGFAYVAMCWPRRPLLLICLVMLGAAAVQVGRMPPVAGPSALVVRAAEIKADFSQWLGRLLPAGDELSVLQALSIGDKSGLDRDLRAAYRNSGAMHLLALSGLHVGLLYALLVRLLAPLGGHRIARLFRSGLILTALWAYAVITGLSASISRAVLMISFYEISGLLSGDRDALSALFGSALLLMLLRPESPRDIGFQLSYTAVLSILLLHPRLKGLLLTRSRLLQRIWELLSVSICCQATCGLLAWYYFGQFPRYFLITTLLAIPLTTATMYTIAATVSFAALASLLPWLAPVSALAVKALTWLLHLLNTVIRLISEL